MSVKYDHNHVNTRVELFEYDPALAEIVKEQLGDIEWKYKKPADRKKRDVKHMAGFDESSKPKFAWPKDLLKWYKQYQQDKKKKKA